ncbi:dTMP kinase [Gammaproteobacteria bacterium]
MKDLLLTVKFTYDDKSMHEKDENSIAIFPGHVLLNEAEPLALHSEALGDKSGTVRVLRINEPNSFMARLAEKQAASAARGRFITIEGIEGCGKTTLIAHLRHLFETAGCRIVVTREPGGTALGEEVRGLFLGREDGMAVDAELLLLFAARAEHLEKIIRPALAAGKWVLCDRFTDATYAYQGGGRGIPEERIALLESWIREGLRPDLTLLLDLPVETGLTRIGRRETLDRFERKEHAFHERVRAVYLALAAAQPKRFRVVDASRPLSEVKYTVGRILAEWFYEGGAS